MRATFAISLFSIFLLAVMSASADVQVKGYYRKDGTYVRPHVRSNPDGNVWNNYGPSRNDYERTNPLTRDNDRDGIPNYIDRDDDNDLRMDDNDESPYGGREDLE